MTFLNPFYSTVFRFIPDFLAILAGTLLLWTIALVLEIIPKWGKYLMYSVFALIAVNTILSIFAALTGGDTGGFTDIVGYGVANSILLIVMLIGLIFFFRVKMGNAWYSWIFGYYGYWVGFFVAMGVISIMQGKHNFGVYIDTYAWLLTLWIATTQILVVTIIKMYKHFKPTYTKAIYIPPR